MPKIKSNAGGIIAKYAVKVILSTAASVLLLCGVMSFILLKLDIDLNAAKYISVGICFISALTVSYFSLGGFKNNMLPLSLLSVVPLLLLSIINFCINKGDGVIIAVKAVLIIAAAVLSSFMRIKKSRG